MGTDRVCGLDEFRVEVINIAEEAERLKEAAKAAAKSKDKEGEEEETDIIPSIPCNIQVSTLTCPWSDAGGETLPVPFLDFNRQTGEHDGQTTSIIPPMNSKVSQSTCCPVRTFFAHCHYRNVALHRPHWHKLAGQHGRDLPGNIHPCLCWGIPGVCGVPRDLPGISAGFDEVPRLS